MSRRVFAFRNVALTLRVSALVLAAIAAAGSAGAQPGGAARFQAYDGVQKPLDISRLAIARADRPVKMLVVLSEPSVASARAQAGGRRIGAGARDAVTARVAAQHATVRPQLEQRGAKVLAQFHSAVNGIKVEVRPSQVAALQALPGVLKVVPVLTHQRNNASTVPYIGAPLVWQGLPGLAAMRGEGVKIAIIDTGIDYTHADFGGPGTVAAFNTAKATNTLPPDPSMVGPNAPKVKGGTDLVGDDYNANVATSVPKPDPNPLDCNSHGTHVAGTAAGFGVTAAGATYHGPYTAAAYTPGAFSIGPGVAPLADLYSVRVFGCAGSTNVVVDAIDWAVEHDVDVISMSLGSDYGPADTADAIAASAAAQAGIVVVAAAGNAGPAPYIASSPGNADDVISVAAIDGRPSFPGVSLKLSTGVTIPAQNSNGAVFADGSTWGVAVLRTSYPSGPVALGCNYPADYTNFPGGLAALAGKMIVTTRGTCARVARAVFAQKAGGAASAMIDSSTGFPPFEGAITSNPDTGEQYVVTIPFFGVRGLPTGTTSDGAKLRDADGGTAVATNATLDNPFIGTVASFSSGGPRIGDSILKPAVAAPGVSVISAGSGTGNGVLVDSGTSMATPHVAGVAALTIQAHPTWNVAELSAAITQTAAPAKLADYKTRLEGAGLVQPANSVQDQVVVSVDGAAASTGVSFGFAEFVRDFDAARTLHVLNKGTSRLTFDVASTPAAGTAHTLTLSRSRVSVAPGETIDMVARLNVPVTSANATHDSGGNAVFYDVAGMITLTPNSDSANGGVKLQVPYYLVPRARSVMTAALGVSGPQQMKVNLSNAGSLVAANADFYALGIEGTRTGAAPYDIRAVGVQSFPLNGTQNLIVFAVNTFDRFSTAAAAEVDIYVDTNNDGVPDYIVLTADIGSVTAGVNNGQAGVFVVNLHTNAIAGPKFATDAPTDGSVMLIPVVSSDLGLTAANPRIVYSAVSFNNSAGGGGQMTSAAAFNVFTSAIETGAYVPLAPGATATVPIAVNAAENAVTPPLGVMVVNQEDKSTKQVTLLKRPQR